MVIKTVWIIEPHDNSDYDFCEMPADSGSDHADALQYAKKVLGILWDD